MAIINFVFGRKFLKRALFDNKINDKIGVMF